MSKYEALKNTMNPETTLVPGVQLPVFLQPEHVSDTGYVTMKPEPLSQQRAAVALKKTHELTHRRSTTLRHNSFKPSAANLRLAQRNEKGQLAFDRMLARRSPTAARRRYDALRPTAPTAPKMPTIAPRTVGLPEQALRLAFKVATHGLLGGSAPQARRKAAPAPRMAQRPQKARQWAMMASAPSPMAA